MNDAELVRFALADMRADIDANGYKNVVALGKVMEAGELIDRLTALAERLESHKLVPREPTQAMQTAGAQAIRINTTAVNKLWTCNAVYRAMLAASEARYLSPDEDRALRRAAVRGGKMLDEEAK